MNLVILNAGQNYHIRGGSDKCLFELEGLLKSHGHDVIPFATSHPRNRPTEWEAYFPPRVNFSNPGLNDLIRYIYSSPAANSLSDLLDNVSIDLAHLHIYYGQLTTSILRLLKSRGIPIVQTLHEYKIVCPVYTLYSNGQICESCRGHAFWHAILKRCNRGSVLRSSLSAVESYVSKFLGSVDKIDHFIAVSNFQRSKVIELGVPPDKITTVYNFISTEDVTPSFKRGEYFLYLGRLERVKGIFSLIKASEDVKDTPLYIVGEGNLRADLESYILSNKLDHIHLLGFKRGEELRKLIRESICLIAPSKWYETFGLTLVESFSHGRPVIASRIGGMTEVVSDGVDGYLIKPGDVESLRDRMQWMTDHPDSAIEMGIAGRKKVEQEFNPDIYYQNTMAVYKKII